ncbi:PTS sugar transporter subunit IIA [Rhodopila globiformis]|uniref:PTS EIIA type-4 domain-containing protein n=1 Tax=Rhodopila globiformis TaxID=1071 RepID=A0A2S6N4Q2_RHOGL|nr:hypothetical protein CCS01_21200 [Rhodopila globiformis]
MIGMVLVTHGRLADELRAAMEHVVGRQRYVDTVCIGPEDDMENCRAKIEDCIGRCDTGEGVVLLTDMAGGMPCNLAISMIERKSVKVIAGVNLPMLVKLAAVRYRQSLADAVSCAEDAGRKYIAAVSAPQSQAPVVLSPPHTLEHQGTTHKPQASVAPPDPHTLERERTVHNERVKLNANFFNTLAGWAAGAGGIGIAITTILSSTPHPWFVPVGFLVGGLVSSSVLKWLAYREIGKLR